MQLSFDILYILTKAFKCIVEGMFTILTGVIGGSLVVSRTRDRGVPGSNPSSGAVDCEK